MLALLGTAGSSVLEQEQVLGGVELVSGSGCSKESTFERWQYP